MREQIRLANRETEKARSHVEKAMLQAQQELQSEQLERPDKDTDRKKRRERKKGKNIDLDNDIEIPMSDQQYLTQATQ